MAFEVSSTAYLGEYFSNSALLDELLSVPFLTEDTQVISTLASTVNNNVRLRHKDNEYFLKCFVDDGLTVNRSKLYQLQLELSQANITPKPVLLAKSGRFQIDSGMLTMNPLTKRIALCSWRKDYLRYIN